MKTNKDLKKDGLMMIRTGVKQNVTTASKERLGPNATSIDGQEERIRNIMEYSGITVEEARQTLRGVKGPRLNEVLEALSRIDSGNQSKP